MLPATEARSTGSTRPTNPPRAALPDRLSAGLFVPAVVVFGAAVARVVLIVRHPEVADAPWTLAALTLQSDALFFAAFCAALWSSARWLRGMALGAARLVLAAFALLYLGDVVTLWIAETRLSWGRFITFFPQLAVIAAFLGDRFGWLGAAGLVGGLLALAGAMLLPRWRITRASSGLLAISAGFALLGVWRPVDTDYLSRWLRDNVAWLNRPNPQKLPYSSAEAERLLAHHAALPQRSLQAAPDRRKVILLIIESWSSYHSRAFGGPLDWTPELDRIAEEHTRFTRFHAGGYCTAEGLVNLLGGIRLWVPFGGLSQLDQLPREWSQRDTLPRAFARAGYHTSFLTTGTLEFVGKGRWLREIGFSETEGSENPFYADWPQLGSFDAAHDEALYRRSLQWIDRAPANSPFFLTIETVSSHIPYLDPDTRARDPEACFRYADRWAAWFVRELEQRGYFDDGILLITSDHRAMLPILPAEKRAFGTAVSSRIPLVLVDRRRARGETIDATFKQADLLPSFRHWLGEPLTLDLLSASLFDAAENPDNVAVHRRDREIALLDVVSGRGEGQVKLAGDKTDFMWARELSRSEQERILALIAAERLATVASPARPPR